MALDASNFLLHLTRASPSSRQLELRLPSSSSGPSPCEEAPYYLFERASSRSYGAQLLDGHARVLLAEWTGSSKKQETLRLCGPEGAVSVSREKGWAGEWRWEWEGETYQWKRETNALGIGSGKAGFACEIVRKPDPSVAVARYRPSLKARPAQLEVFDYNLLRIDISDRKGLEITLVCVLLALLDGEAEEALGALGEVAGEDAPVGTPAVAGAAGAGAAAAPMGLSLAADARQASNEVEVTPYGEDAAYVAHCLRLLRCDDGGGADAAGAGMDLIVLQANSADAARRAVGIAAAVKGAYYRLPQAAKGLPSASAASAAADVDAAGAGELFQYVRAPELPAGGSSTSSSSTEATAAQALAAEVRARPRIQLNAPSPAAGTGGSRPGTPARPTSAGAPREYAPPERLSIYLSKLRIAELERPLAAPMGGAAQARPLSSPGPMHAQGQGQGQRPRPLSHNPSPSPSATPAPPSPPKQEREARGVGRLLGRLGRRGGAGHAQEQH